MPAAGVASGAPAALARARRHARWPRCRTRRASSPAFMDRSVDPCVDFYAYSCNGWRSAEPDSARPVALERLRQALQRESAVSLGAARRGGGEPGDRRIPSCASSATTFAACMDLAAIDKAGPRPDPRRDDGDRQAQGARGARAAPRPAPSRRAGARPALRLRHASRTRATPRSASPSFTPAAWACRIATTTSRPTPPRVALRAKYVEHTARNFRLMGEAPDWAAESAAIVLAIETDLAQRLAVARRPARSAQGLPSDEPRRAAEADSGLRLEGVLRRGRRRGGGRGLRRRRQRAGVPEGGADRSSPSVRSPTSGPICAGRCCAAAAEDLSAPYREADFDFYVEDAARECRAAGALAGLRRRGRPRPRRGAGQGLRRAAVRAGDPGAPPRRWCAASTRRWASG